MENHKTQKMKEMVEMINIYYSLPKEGQVYVSGLIAGLAALKDISVEKTVNA